MKDQESRNKILKSANLKNNEFYSNIYINKDLTKNEIEEEKALKKFKNEKNEELEYLEGRHRFGKTNDGRDFFWGIRFGQICRIDKITRKKI